MKSLFKDVKKVLVIKLRHIGDVLLSVPAIRALREGLPEAEIYAIVNSGTEDMLTLNPLIKGIIRYDRDMKKRSIAGRLRGERDFIKEVRGKGFDMTVDFTGGDRPAIAGLLSGARLRLGFDPQGRGFLGKVFFYTHVATPPPGMTHAVLKDLHLVRSFGFDTGDIGVDIYTSPEDDGFVERVLEENGLKDGAGFVHVHPTSRWFFKCWSDSGMAAVMDMLQERGLRVVVTSGPDEKEMKKVSSITGLMRTDPVDLSGRLNLKRLASLSRRARFFFGVDSAPMHIAAATGVPVVGIFGPSGAFNWGPWDNNTAPAAGFGKGDSTAGPALSPYSRSNGVQTFGAHTVIQKDWDCIPCGKDGCEGTKKSDCLDSIEPGFVWGILKGYAARGADRSKDAG